MRKLSIGFVLVAVVSLVACAAVTLDVHFIDIGQGDAILITYKEYELLIDGGPGTDFSEYLCRHVCGAIDHVVATHMDKDHILGLVDVFLNFEVSNLWTNGDTETTDAYYAFRDAYLNEPDCEIKIASRGGLIMLGDISVRILHPVALVADKNSNSIVLHLSFNGRSFLFTGDIDIAVEEELVRLGLLSDVDVLKLAHHGSDDSNGIALLEAVTPEFCVASTSGQYGHPHLATINRLSCTARNGGRWLINTNVHGSFVIKVDAHGNLNYSTTTGRSPTSLNCEPDPEPGQIWINEVEANPSGTDKGNEWIELFNSGSTAKDIGGWQIIATSGTPDTVPIPRGTTIQPGAFLLFYSFAQWIDNESEVIELRDDSGTLVDKTPSISDFSNSGTTWARVPNGAANWIMQQGTRGNSNN